MDFTLSTLSSHSCLLEDAVSATILSVLLASPMRRSRRTRLAAVSSLSLSKTAYLAAVSPSSTLPRYDDEQTQEEGGCPSFFHRDSLKVVVSKEQQQAEESDDDTASTVTATSVDEDSDEEDSVSSLSMLSSSTIPRGSSTATTTKQRRAVSFAATQLETVHCVEKTTEEDKYYLWYTDVDYIDFKLDYLTNGKSPLVRRTPRRVGFAREVVESTHQVMGMNERLQLELYYNEDELQTFLDNFVESLQTQQQQHHFR